MHGEDSLKQASRGRAEVMQSQKKAFINEKQRIASVRFFKRPCELDRRELGYDHFL